MNIKDRVCVVTGANTGIGLETARGLAAQGGRVVLCARSEDKGQAAVDDVRESTGNQAVELCVFDLASLESVRRGAAELLERCPALHVLVNNAGLILGDRRLTEDGLEATIGINHFGPFLLTSLLLPRLRESAPARIVNVSSAAHQAAPKGLDFDDLHYADKKYSSFGAYAGSKLANIYFTTALAKRLAGSGVTVNALHPGVIRSGFARDGDTKGFFAFLIKLGGPLLSSTRTGARTSLYLASSTEVEGVSGEYFARCKVKRPTKVAKDEQAAERLWQLSVEATGAPVG
jgi:retinol dehydrogenase-12